MNKAWCRLKQAGKTAHDDLAGRLAEGGHHKAGLLEGCFQHETCDINFALVVDDFLVQHNNNEDLEHLVKTVQKCCEFKADAEAKQFVGIQLQWDCDKQTERLSMPGHIKQALAGSLRNCGCALERFEIFV